MWIHFECKASMGQYEARSRPAGRAHENRGGTICASVCLWLLIAGLTACEKSIDPATGQAQTRWAVPLTAANAETAAAQWRRCTQFRSESYCARNLPGGRPIGTSPAQPTGNDDLLQRGNDP
jgi:hypothetical protein